MSQLLPELSAFPFRQCDSVQAISTKCATEAFVTLVMLDEKYVAAALVLASSLRATSPGVPRVCIHSKDIGAEARNALQVLFHFVVEVPHICGEGVQMRGERFAKRYEWIDYSFTRLQALHVGRLLGFEKLIVLDADTLAIGDLSELFSLEPPAGILSLDDFPHSAAHGRKLDQSQVEKAVHHSYGIRGCLQLLSTKEEDFVHLIETLGQWPKHRPGYVGGYGSEDAFVGPDERLLTECYQRLHGWTHIHQRFCMTSFHLCKLQKNDEVVGVHFVSQKPWEVKDGEKEYPDFKLWCCEATLLLSRHPDLERFFPSYVRRRLHRRRADTLLDETQVEQFSKRLVAQHHPAVEKLLSASSTEF